MPSARKRKLTNAHNEAMSASKQPRKRKVAPVPSQGKKVIARFAPGKWPKGRSKASLEIPAEISDFVEELNRQEYKFTYQFGDIEQFNHLAWAMSKSTTEITVRLVCKDDYDGFCIHLAPDHRRKKDCRIHYRTDKPWKYAVTCVKQYNFLLYVLGRELHDFMTDSRRSLAEIHDKIKGILDSDPSKSCAVCAQPFDANVKIWRLTTCGKERCINMMKLWPLDIRISPLTLDATVLDFLLCCCLAARSHEGLSASVDVTTAINSLPPLRNCMPLSELTVGGKKERKEKAGFLSWLCNSFQACIISAPTDHQVSWGSQLGHQFIILNNRSDVQEGFDKRKVALGGNCGTAAFHGTANYNLVSILMNGLQAKFSRPGCYDAVFYAHQPNYSIPYITYRWNLQNPCVPTWTNSQFKGQNLLALFGLEVTSSRKPVPDSEGHTLREEEVMIRHIFLIPAEKHPQYKLPLPLGHARWVPCSPTARRCDIEREMETTFEMIHSDERHWV